MGLPGSGKGGRRTAWQDRSGRVLFETDRDHCHFLELLEEASDRYGVEIHAYALMGNHYHLLIRTPRANASRVLQWLNVSYSAWFNRKRERVGPLRLTGLGPGKQEHRAEALGLTMPDAEAMRNRLRVLRGYRWSSFRAYAGYEKGPPWLQMDELLRRGGGRRSYRRFVQQHVTRGVDPEGFEDLGGRLVLGAQAFQEKAARWVQRVTSEQPQRKWLTRGVPFEVIVRVVEKKRKTSWPEICDRHGDWGRDLALYLARQRSGRTLREIGDALGGLEYKTTGKAIQRFAASLVQDSFRRNTVPECLRELSNVET